MAKILMGITGSIAAYKSLELIRLLIKNQHEVKVILTNSAQNFITKTAILALGADVFVDSEGYGSKDAIMQHISLAKWPDLIVIVPLSANTLSNIANGLGNNLLTTTLLASNSQVFLVPAMNMEMWSNSLIEENVAKLNKHGFRFIGPITGLQACGDNGAGRMVEPFEVYKYITHYTISLQYPQMNLRDKKIVITLGGTIENIDPVRYIGNRSSGKMGMELAYASLAYGAEVIIIAANVDVELPESIRVINVGSADEMFKQTYQVVSDADIFISCAAVADYKIEKYAENKIKKNEKVTLELVKNIDIISTVRKIFRHLYIIGFAAESHDLIEHAKCKLKNKNLDLIIANDIKNNQIFGADDTKVSILNKSGEVIDIPANNKAKIAHDIIFATITQVKN